MKDIGTIGLWVSGATAVAVAGYPVLYSALVQLGARRVTIEAIADGRQEYKIAFAAKGMALLSCVFASLPLVIAYLAPRLGAVGIVVCWGFAILMFRSGINQLRMLARSMIVLEHGRLNYKHGKCEEVCDIYDAKSVYVSGGYVVIKRTDSSHLEFPLCFQRMPVLLAQLQFACRAKAIHDGPASP